MELFLSQLVNGLSNSAILFLSAIGLVIVFGMLDVVNMAHGEFIMLGAYVGCTCINSFHLPFISACAAAFIITAAIGAVVEQALIKRLYGKVAETLLATFALTYVFQQIIRSIYGPEDQTMSLPVEGSITLGSVTIPVYNLILIGVAVCVLAATLLLFFKTSYGMQLRAITQNRTMTQCLGINTSKIDCITFAYGCGLAGLAGVLLGPVRSITPTMGTSYIVDSFLVVVLGGLKSILGTFAGSFVISESSTVMAGYMSEITARLLIFIVIIVLIRVKPQGLFSAKEKR